ncbi:hypothetical protein [Streptomyces sp. NBC_01314]|nr:hypothetical protein OG622_30180 [Streptomyces sp. NBC_01314]
MEDSSGAVGRRYCRERADPLPSTMYGNGQVLLRSVRVTAMGGA